MHSLLIVCKEIILFTTKSRFLDGGFEQMLRLWQWRNMILLTCVNCSDEVKIRPCVSFQSGWSRPPNVSLDGTIASKVLLVWTHSRDFGRSLLAAPS